MKKLKSAGFWNLSWLGGKSTYTLDKWNGDQDDPHGDHGRVEELYLANGYVLSRIGQPRVSYFDGRAGFIRKKPVKWVRLEIPVTEGEQYRVGEIKLEGLKVFKEAFVRPMFKLQTGDIYDDTRLKKGYEKLRDVYGRLGYFQFTGGTKRTTDTERKVVDVTLALEEDKQYFVGKLEFKGNNSSRDKVIRREIFMNEGDVFDTEALKVSVRRINQLGYFKPMEGAPDIVPSTSAEDRMDVTFKVDEQNRNQFTFGGGVSGYEGAFVNASFQTANFLGKGETLTLSAQSGSRTRNYQFSINEPYFLDRPITAGIDVFFRRITYQSYGTFVGFGQQSQGLSVSTGVAVGRFSRVFAGYSYQIIDIYEADALRGNALSSESSTTAVDASYYGGYGRRFESGISPSFVRNTVDNPYQPRSGSRYSASVNSSEDRWVGVSATFGPTSNSFGTSPSVGRWPSASEGRWATSKRSGTPRRSPTTSGTSSGERTRSGATTCALSRPTIRIRPRPSAVTSSCSSTPNTTSTSLARSGRCCSSTPDSPTRQDRASIGRP